MLEISVEWKSFANYWNTHVELKIFNPHKRSHKSKEKGPSGLQLLVGRRGLLCANLAPTDDRRASSTQQRVKINAINAT